MVQQFVKLGSENGHHFSSTGVEDFIAKNQLDDVQLEAVAGGLPNASSLIRKPLEPNGIIAILIGL